MLVRFLLSFCVCFSGLALAQSDVPLMPKHCSFDYDYHQLSLENGLKVLLISDPEETQAGVSMDVAVGTKDDPSDMPGMAHFLEHMLFLGSEKYSDADVYSRYIEQHGGYANATTDYANTNYYFQINTEYLEGALAIFADQFVSPTLDPYYIERESNAVNAEYEYRKNRLYWRMRDVANEVYGARHPRARFGMGNSSTLNRVSAGNLTKRVRAWWENQYSADKMALVIRSSQPMSELIDIANKYFSEIKKSDDSYIRFPTPLEYQNLPGVAKLDLGKAKRYMVLHFPLTGDLSDIHQYAAEEFVSFLLEQQVEGTFANRLLVDELGDGVSVEFNLDDPNSPRIEMYIDIYYDGSQQYWEVIRRLMAYVDLLQSSTLEEWRFDEFLQIKAMQWCYSTNWDASEMAYNFQRYGFKYSISKGYAAESYDPETVKKLLSFIRVDNMLVLVSNPDFMTSQYSRWFGTAFDYEPIEENNLVHYMPKVERKVRETTRNPHSKKMVEKVEDYSLTLPKKNPFIPKHLTKSSLVDQKSPKALDIHPNVDAWYGNDRSFNSPTSMFYVLLRSPVADSNSQNAALVYLMKSFLEENLQESISAATDVDTYLDITREANGIGLYFVGYRDSIELLLDEVLKQLRNLKVDEDTFAGYRYGWMGYLKRRDEQPPLSIANLLQTKLLYAPDFSDDDIAAGMRGSSWARLVNLMEDWKSAMWVTSLVYGNVSETQAIDWNKKIANSLIKKEGKVEVVEAVMKLPYGINRLLDETAFSDSAVLVYLQGESTGPEERAKFLLLERLLASRFYSDLRTEEQLGYVVDSRYESFVGYPGITFSVLSPVAAANVLEDSILEFVEKFASNLKALPPEEFQSYVSATVTELKSEADDQEEQADRVWDAMNNAGYNFTVREEIVNSLENLDKDAFFDWYIQRALPGKSRLLSILIEGDSHSLSWGWKSQIGDTRIDSIDDFREVTDSWKILAGKQNLNRD
ncbi:insulinase family protein [Hahella ganghwensis]|uniref:insulinase family protein n=1 Tax=Hahella ganghwensis TaxID=286420 RepID=UPI00039FBEB5|nr:insulinase family protein [Hahella ganghwensis]